MTYNYNSMSDAQLDHLLYLEKLKDSPESGAIVEEIETRQLVRDYNPAYTIRIYFSTGDSSPWLAARSIAKRSESEFTFHRTWGSWKGEVETSCVVEFIHNPRQVSYLDAVKDSLKLAGSLVREYNQEAAVITCDGLGGIGGGYATRQWLVERDDG